MSDRTKFTPGPWEARVGEFDFCSNDGQRPIMVGADENTRPVAIVVRSKKEKRGTKYNAPDAERDANVHLIAAAPELYKALSNMLWEKTPETIDEAERVLKKARGEV